MEGVEVDGQAFDAIEFELCAGDCQIDVILGLFVRSRQETPNLMKM